MKSVKCNWASLCAFRCPSDMKLSRSNSERDSAGAADLTDESVCMRMMKLAELSDLEDGRKRPVIFAQPGEP